jgi:hypothetical protein
LRCCHALRCNHKKAANVKNIIGFIGPVPFRVAA